MVRDDIVAGLKNAIERGYSLDQAKHSFISAGYNREEVEEASNFVHSGSVLAQEEKRPVLKAVTAVEPSGKQEIEKQAEPEKEAPKQIEKTNKPGRNWKVILLVAILAILVAVLVITIIFREKILAWFT